MSEIATEWKELQSSGLALPFQNYEWCKAWVNHGAKDFAIKQCIMCGRDQAGEITFILPFQMRSILGCQSLEWLGQQTGIACDGIYAEPFCSSQGENWFTSNMAALLLLLGPVDVLNLRNMPTTLMGRPSPLAILHQSQTANASFVLDLQADYETLLAKKRSSRSISKMRRRDERLEKSGTLTFESLRGGSATNALIEGLNHKNLQLNQTGAGVVFKDIDIKYYLQILQTQPQLLEVFKLRLNGKTLATMFGAKANGYFCLLISALAPDANLQFSPGDYLLRRTIAYCCSNQFSTYDFGFGDHEYKQVWADHRVVHFNAIKAQSFRGIAIALVSNLTELAKRKVKKNIQLRNAYYYLRKRLWASKG